MKKKFLFLIYIIVFLIVFRGPVFRFLINYEPLSTRTIIPLIDDAEVKFILPDYPAINFSPTIEQVIMLSERETYDILEFSTDSVSNDPNVLRHSKKANCVGYAALFSSISSMMIERFDASDKIKVEHKVAKIHFLSLNLHQFFTDPFFKDHDYVLITDLTTGERVAIDPSLSDTVGIEYVTAD